MTIIILILALWVAVVVLYAYGMLCTPDYEELYALLDAEEP